MQHTLNVIIMVQKMVYAFQEMISNNHLLK